MLKHLLISAMIIFLAFTWSCGITPYHRDSTVNKNWGRSFESAKYNQILNPEAGTNLEPVTGLDGDPSDYNVNKYKESFKKTEQKEVINVLQLQ
jgi:hypothetical protein